MKKIQFFYKVMSVLHVFPMVCLQQTLKSIEGGGHFLPIGDADKNHLCKGGLPPFALFKPLLSTVLQNT